MVVYSINAKTGLSGGTTIDNNAGIYFDVNAVVTTNTVENKIISTTSVAPVSNIRTVKIYPNPVDDMLTLQTNGGYNILNITNTIGQLIMSQTINGAQTQINVSALPSGMYFITLKGDSGVTVQKFEKM